MLIFCLIFASTPLYAKGSKEQNLKIAFTSKIIGLIKWNKQSHNNLKKSLKIGILDDYAVYELMSKYYSKKKVQKKNIEVVNISITDIDESFDVLYVSEDFNGVIEDLVKICETYTVLLMSSSDGFGDKGSHINFFIDSKKLRFEINLTSLKKANLHVNSFLLNYAKVIGGD